MTDRHAFRAKWHDYNGGIYFVTICTHDKRHIFGEIIDAEMHLSPIGTILEEFTKSINTHYPDIELWNYVVMPNHIHLVVAIASDPLSDCPADNKTSIGCLRQSNHEESTDDFHHNSRLAAAIGSLKSALTRTVRKMQLSPPNVKIWQRSFNDSIIRNQHSYENIMQYIDDNVAQWGSDEYQYNPTQGKM